MSRRTRTIRYGGAIVVVLVGVVCGIAIPGTAGGTLATVFVGLGLVGVVMLIFYEVGLTEDRDRARPSSPPPVGSRSADPHGEPPRSPPANRHEELRRSPPPRLRGQRRRLR